MRKDIPLRLVRLAAEMENGKTREHNPIHPTKRRIRQINSDVLALAEELSKGTIERQLAKSDFELGLEMLLRIANGEDPLKR